MSAPTGEAQTIQQTRRELAAFTARATMYLDQVEEAKRIAANLRAEADALMAHAAQLQASMAGQEVDQGTLAAIAGLGERAAQLRAAAARLDAAAKNLASAAEALRASAGTAKAGINSRHSGVEEASQAAPEGGAVKGYYGD